MNIDLQRKVDEALDEAVFLHGYVDTVSHNPLAIALDLVEWSKAFEDERVTDLVRCIADYQVWFRAEGIVNDKPRTA